MAALAATIAPQASPRAALPASYDDNRASAFAERMSEVLNAGAIALMVSIGHRARLFDTMANMSPATSSEIATASGLNERYVREWLSSMVAGRLIEYDPATRTYALPIEHATVLGRESSDHANAAVAMQFLPLLGGVESQILDCFRHGGGLAYSAYERFHEVVAEESAQTVVGALTDRILPLIPGLSRRLENGIDVLDIGCGSGRALLALADAFPDSRFTGYDICEDAIARATARAEEEGLTNVRFEVRDVTRLGEIGMYDLITAFDAIHDQKDPRAVMVSVRRALKTGGCFLMQDIKASSFLEHNLEHPMAPYLYTMSCMHSMAVSLGQDGAGLGAMWGEEQARALLRDAGFHAVQVSQLPHDDMNCYYVAR